jgi:TonB family protein
MLRGLVVVTLLGLSNLAYAEERSACDECVRAYEDEPGTASCWGTTPAIENNDRVEGKRLVLDKRFERVRLKSTRITAMLCIDETGRVQRVLILESSGNAELDCHVCQHYMKWRYRPAQAHGKATVSYSRVIIEFHI